MEENVNTKILDLVERISKIEHKVDLVWKVCGLIGTVVGLAIIGALLKLIIL